TTIGGGSTLAVGAGGSLSAGSALDLAGTGAALDISAATTPQTSGMLSGVAGTNVNLGGNTLTLAGTGNGNYAGTIGGTGGLTMAGTGTETLTGTNTYTGATTINSGTLAIGAGGSLSASSPVNLAGAGATFDVSGATTPQTTGTLSGVAGS
ncbi:autotransporter-associated beta strand repeat-containing protein, partial [Burkholderia cenocepacia]